MAKKPTAAGTASAPRTHKTGGAKKSIAKSKPRPRPAVQLAIAQCVAQPPAAEEMPVAAAAADAGPATAEVAKRKKVTRKLLATHFTRAQIRDAVCNMLHSKVLVDFGGVNKLNKQQLLEQVDSRLLGNLFAEVLQLSRHQHAQLQQQHASMASLNPLQRHQVTMLEGFSLKMIRLGAKGAGVSVQGGNTLPKAEYVARLVAGGRAGQVISHIGVPNAASVAAPADMPCPTGAECAAVAVGAA